MRGVSIAGWYGDEINLHAKSAIVEFFNRSIASTDRKNFGTLNPSPPRHWIYTEFLDKYEEAKLPGFRLFRFTLDNNPAISEERKAELRSQYTGIFYQRFILGRRVRAEGACYPSFSRKVNIVNKIPKEHGAPCRLTLTQIGSDIGGTGSATTNVLSGIIHIGGQLCLIVLDETYDSENKSTESILSIFKQFALSSKKRYNCYDSYCDSAEQLIKKSMGNMGILNVHNSLKRPIVDRIRFADWLMASGRFFVMRHCKNVIEAIETAVWSEKSGSKEERLDDGSSNIDSLDAMEYSFESRMGDFI